MDHGQQVRLDHLDLLIPTWDPITIMDHLHLITEVSWEGPVTSGDHLITLSHGVVAMDVDVEEEDLHLM